MKNIFDKEFKKFVKETWLQIFIVVVLMMGITFLLDRHSEKMEAKRIEIDNCLMVDITEGVTRRWDDLSSFFEVFNEYQGTIYSNGQEIRVKSVSSFVCTIQLQNTKTDEYLNPVQIKSYQAKIIRNYIINYILVEKRKEINTIREESEQSEKNKKINKEQTIKALDNLCK
jgi:hypothetical protein